MTNRRERVVPGPGRPLADIDAVFRGDRTGHGAAVAVTVKRRRAIAAAPPPEPLDGDAGLQHPRTDDRPPRVFTIAAPVAAPAGEAPAPDIAVARVRRRKDALHAPGVVTRIVFEPPEPAVPAANDDEAWPTSRDSDGYRQVLAALDHVRATLRSAQAARSFRVV